MSSDAQDREPETLQEDELTALKNRADMIGLSYHPKIGLEKLKAKVNAQLAKTAKQVQEEKKAEPVLDQNAPASVQTNLYASPDTPVKKRETVAMRKIRLRKQASRLIRFRLTCMNPAKKDWPGETFTASNCTIGTFKRHIPFNADAWHCEQIILNMMQEREYLSFYSVKDKKGREMKRHKMVKEFAIEVLPPLTQKEIDLIAASQKGANRLED